MKPYTLIGVFLDHPSAVGETIIQHVLAERPEDAHVLKDEDRPWSIVAVFRRAPDTRVCREAGMSAMPNAPEGEPRVKVEIAKIDNPYNPSKCWVLRWQSDQMSAPAFEYFESEAEAEAEAAKMRDR